jgi:hypothetical protein
MLRFSGWQPAFDPVLYALHEGTGRMAGNVDPLHPIFQGQAETAPFPLRSAVGALQPEQVCQPHADALVIAFGALVV